MGWIFPLALVSGIMILLGGMLMYLKPQEKKVGEIIVIVFSAIGFTAMGFSILGAIIGNNRLSCCFS